MRISREIDIGIAPAIQPGQMEAAQFVAVARWKQGGASRPRNDGVHVDKMSPSAKGERANIGRGTCYDQCSSKVGSDSSSRSKSVIIHAVLDTRRELSTCPPAPSENKVSSLQDKRIGCRMPNRILVDT